MKLNSNNLPLDILERKTQSIVGPFAKSNFTNNYILTTNNYVNVNKCLIECLWSA